MEEPQSEEVSATETERVQTVFYGVVVARLFESEMTALSPIL
jgi:hypothetical protein